MDHGQGEAEGAPGGLSGPGLTKRQFAAVVAGNALEFYDFGVYAYLAVYIAQTFFPSTDQNASLLATLATYGAGYITRPLGAFFIGRLADRKGRRPAMLLSFAMMGGVTAAMALVPSYAQIGVAAPILVLLLRLLQGFSVGGEVGPSVSYLVESAPAGRRGLYVGFQYFGQTIATLMAAAVGLMLTSVFDAEAMRGFGWRIAMLAGVLIVPLGLLLRRALPETLHLAEPVTADAASVKPPSPPIILALVSLVLLSASTSVAHVLSYLPTHLIGALHMPARQVFTAASVAALVGTLIPLVGGWLCDRFGRRPTMLAPWAILLVVTLPAFQLLMRTPSLGATVAAFLALAVGGLSSVAILTAITEAIPKQVRSTQLAMIYAVAVGIFGGMTQFNLALATRLFNSPLAPGWYMVCAVMAGLLAMLALPARNAKAA